MEQRVDAGFEQPRDPERRLERRRIMALLDRRDRLAGEPDRGAELALRHAACFAFGADIVGDGEHQPARWCAIRNADWRVHSANTIANSTASPTIGPSKPRCS